MCVCVCARERVRVEAHLNISHAHTSRPGGHLSDAGGGARSLRHLFAARPSAQHDQRASETAAGIMVTEWVAAALLVLCASPGAESKGEQQVFGYPQPGSVVGGDFRRAPRSEQVSRSAHRQCDFRWNWYHFDCCWFDITWENSIVIRYIIFSICVWSPGLFPSHFQQTIDDAPQIQPKAIKM